jgi:hypothetical protein
MFLRSDDGSGTLQHAPGLDLDAPLQRNGRA